MSEDIRANVVRAGVDTPIATNIFIQLDELSAMEASSYQGADPHFTYKCYTTMLPLDNPEFVLFRDALVDQVVIDAVTGMPRKFRIISEPKLHSIDGHWQFVVERLRGK